MGQERSNEQGPAGPRYTQFGVASRISAACGAQVLTCEDCGVLVTNEKAHTRFHSILSGHAWSLAVLKTAHIADHVHDQYNVVERIDSRKFDSWSADALAEVMAGLETGPADEPEHDERCCMNGIAPGKGPHPDCPGVQIGHGNTQTNVFGG
jgi:hypothetical protein